jgi:deoxycytidine triphosphate deaminase
MAKSKAQVGENISVVNPKGILTLNEIKELELIRLDENQISDDSCYSNASYDFRIGEKYAFPSEEIDNIKICEAKTLECPHRKNDKPKIYSCKKDNYVIRIPAFTSIVFTTYEKVSIPNNVAGRFDLRIKWALQGLILQVGTQIEPGYNGRLFGLLHNLSNKELCIPSNNRLLTAEFSYTSEVALPRKNKIELETIEQFLDKYHAISGTLEYFLKELNETKVKMDKGYREILEGNRYKMTVGLAIASIFLSVFLSVGVSAIVSKYSLEKDDYPFQKVYEMEQQNIELRKQVLKLNESLLNLDMKLDSIKIPEKPIGKGGQK